MKNRLLVLFGLRRKSLSIWHGLLLVAFNFWLTKQTDKDKALDFAFALVKKMKVWRKKEVKLGVLLFCRIKQCTPLIGDTLETDSWLFRSLPSGLLLWMENNWRKITSMLHELTQRNSKVSKDSSSMIYSTQEKRIDKDKSARNKPHAGKNQVEVSSREECSKYWGLTRCCKICFQRTSSSITHSCGKSQPKQHTLPRTKQAPPKNCKIETKCHSNTQAFRDGIYCESDKCLSLF